MLSVHPEIKKEVSELEAYTDYLNYDEQEAQAELKEIEAIEKELKIKGDKKEVKINE
jgi:hypothetical protein